MSRWKDTHCGMRKYRKSDGQNCCKRLREHNSCKIAVPMGSRNLLHDIVAAQCTVIQSLIPGTESERHLSSFLRSTVNAFTAAADADLFASNAEATSCSSSSSSSSRERTQVRTQYDGDVRIS